MQASKTVSKSLQPAKTRARSQIVNVTIRKDAIVWRVKGINAEIKKAVEIENKRLEQNKLLLIAMGLPSHIECQLPKARYQKTVNSDNIPAYILATPKSIIIDVKQYRSPLVLTADSFPDLYEKIVESFCSIQANEQSDYENYFGPTILEVTNLDSDDSSTRIRSESNINFAQIQKYTELWLASDKHAAKSFYFGYTHGQRIYRYAYPATGKDLKTKTVANWEGTLSQFKSIISNLETEQKNARRAYAVIANPTIDNCGSKYHRPELVAPSLIAVHFQIEQNNKLSAFALLRSQELSLFSAVNYLELKTLMQRIIEKLADSDIILTPGRAVMMSTLSYFAPQTTLLDKPKICRKTSAQIRSYARKLDRADNREEVRVLLQDFVGRDYKQIDTDWCDPFSKGLDGKFKHLKTTLKQVKGSLDKLSEKKSTFSITPAKIIGEKKKLINQLFDKIEEIANE